MAETVELKKSVLDAQMELIRLFAKQLRQGGYHTSEGRNLLANRLDGVAENIGASTGHLRTAGLVSVPVLKEGEL